MKRIQIEEERDDSILVLSPSGRLDGANAYTFDSAVMNHIAKGERALLVDLSRLDFISSAGLVVIRKAQKKLARRDGRIVLCGAPAWICEFLSAGGLSTRIPVCASRAAATARLAEMAEMACNARRRWWTRVGGIRRPVTEQ